MSYAGRLSWDTWHALVYMLHANSGSMRREPNRMPPGPKRAPGRAVTPFHIDQWGQLRVLLQLDRDEDATS